MEKQSKMTQVPNNNFITKVFNEISLQTNIELWMSEQDFFLQNRIELIASYAETMFPEELFNLSKRKHLMKNSKLSQGFKTKAEKLELAQDWKQCLQTLNLSLTFADPVEDAEMVQKLILQRAEILDKLDSTLKDGLDREKEAKIG